jgi:hypothetical protein
MGMDRVEKAILESQGQIRDKAIAIVEKRAISDMRREGELTASIKKIEDFISRSASEIEKDGMLIDPETGRLNPMGYSSVYTADEIARDNEKVEERKSKWETGVDKRVLQGERLELLKTAIFQKHMSNKFIVVRSSEYDDIFNNIDNVILNKQTGEVVCAIDDFCDNPMGRKGLDLSVKKTRTEQFNQHGTAKLKYSLGIDNSTGQKRPVARGEELKIPVFYLSISPEDLEAYIRTFDTTGDSAGHSEINLLKIFISQLTTQIFEFGLPTKKTDPDVKGKALRFLDEIRPYLDKEQLITK